MNTQEPRPHLRFCLATLTLAPILFTALHDLIALLLNHPRAILYTTQHQQRQWLAWDSQLLFAALIIYLLNAIIAFILARAAIRRKGKRIRNIKRSTANAIGTSLNFISGCLTPKAA